MAKITKAKLIELQKKLKTDNKIGQQYGITRQAVFQLRKKYGIEPVIDKNAERNQKIIEAHKAGKSGRTLAKKFKLSVSQTCRIIEKSKSGKKVTKKKPAKKKTNPKAIGTWPTPEKPSRKKKKTAKKKVVKKKKK